MQLPAWISQAKDWLLGGNLVAKIGLMILFIGVGFLVKYASARVTVPIELRLAGIVAADIALLLWGWRIREQRPMIALPVQGGALAILMLTTFAAFRLYGLIPGSLAFGLLFALTAFTCALAVLQDAVWLAVFGIVGGFAAPILTSTGQGDHVGLFTYYALLNAGILFIALRRSWRLLNLLGFAFTFVIGTAWGVTRYVPENYASAQAFLALFFVFYVTIALLYARREAPRLTYYVDGTLVFGTPLAASGLQYGLVHDLRFGLAFSALALGVSYIGLALSLWRRRGDTLRLLVESFLALGIVFGTLAIPFALDGRWTSAAWALEGAGVVWIGLRQRRPLAWGFGLLVQVGAWISYLAASTTLTADEARHANLWLGFLLLALTGFALAINFRREAQRLTNGTDEDEASLPGMPFIELFPALAGVFLAFSAIWLLAGAWTEIMLRAGLHQPTLLVISALVVTGCLALIAQRLVWRIASHFALVPQILAGGAFLFLTAFDPTRLASGFVSGNLVDTPFIGSLLIALAAGLSSYRFSRQDENGPRSIARILLWWCGFWWFFEALGSFGNWGDQWLLHLGLVEYFGHPAIHPVYGLLVAITTPLLARWANRLEWPGLRGLTVLVWPVLAYANVALIIQLGDGMSRLWSYGGPRLPDALIWLDFLALWLSSEYLLKDGATRGWLDEATHPRWLRALHTLRTAGPWLLLWPLCRHLVMLFFSVGSSTEAALLSESGWFTAGSWARYLPTWAMMGVVALLIPRARSIRWPTVPISDWYQRRLLPLGTLWSVALIASWNFTQNGRMEPLPYLPILNPLDLTTGFAALLTISTWRLYRQDDDSALPFRPDVVGWSLAYVWFNLMLLRTAAHFLTIDYQFVPLFASQFIQAMLSLVWTTTALVLMRFAARRALRLPWMTGAGLLVLVIAKLFLVDLTNVGGIERIVSFLGVGALMLAIGYLAPFPTVKTADNGTTEENTPE